MNIPLYKPLWNWRNKENQNGLYPVHIRISIGSIHKYFSVKVPVKIRKEQWSDKPGVWVKNNHPFAFEINNALKEKTRVLDDLIKRYFSAKKTLTFPLIFKELGKNNNSGSFNDYFKEFIQDPPETYNEETLKRYSACLKHLNSFNDAITFNDLSDELFQDFKKYCETKANLVASTTNGYFNALKKVIHWARKDNHISKDHQESIFEDIHIKVGKPKKDHLEVEEIIQWKNFVFEEKQRSFIKDRDMFLLQIYSGLYYNDLKSLSKKDLHKDSECGYYLRVDRYKNNNLAIIPLWKFPGAIEIINKYKDHHRDNPLLLDRNFLMEDQVYNRRLKTIAGLLKWNRNVYNKLGRTSNTQLYIRFGAQRSIVSKMLGHEREETTKAYFEVNLRDVIEGTRNVDFQKLGI
jgi:site-specific recombinase XerD